MYVCSYTYTHICVYICIFFTIKARRGGKQTTLYGVTHDAALSHLRKPQWKSRDYAERKVVPHPAGTYTTWETVLPITLGSCKFPNTPKLQRPVKIPCAKLHPWPKLHLSELIRLQITQTSSEIFNHPLRKKPRIQCSSLLVSGVGFQVPYSLQSEASFSYNACRISYLFQYKIQNLEAHIFTKEL